ncbi:MAG: DUF1641 domain-containing protein [Candidatus Magnetoovum sp. WYHC-5]|nr:DUF1641 domain-containing protein [Candidatus Magnetoovum sp. WYHC-5]
MGKKSYGGGSSDIEQLTAKMDDLQKKLQFVEDLVTDLMPGFDKMSKELNSTINELRIRFERDETLELIKKIGDNIPTFLELQNLMGVFKGLIEDLAPAFNKLPKELTPAINELRMRYEKDEVFELIKKTGDNIPTFLQMIDVMGAFKGLADDLLPTFQKITKELMPSINMLRLAFEKDELLDVAKMTGENLGAFKKLLGFLTEYDKSGDLDFTLQTMAAKETEYMMKGLEKCAVRTMKDLMEKPIKPGFLSIFSSLRDPEVQKGFVIMTTFARNMPQCMLETVEEDGEKIKGT